MITDNIELDFTLVSKIITQLINSDGMDTKDNFRLINQKIYYIDNVAVIEELEKIVFEHYYRELFNEKGYVNMDELLEKYSPQYINYDKCFREYVKKYDPEAMESEEKPETDNTLNKYF